MVDWIETEFGKIPNTWGVSTLDKICSLITDGSHSSPKVQIGGRLMASVKDMRYNCFDYKECKTISENDFIELKRNNCSPQKGDILVSKDGANCLDLIFEYQQMEEIVLLSSIAILRVKPEYSSTFYRYFLLSPNCQYLMRNNFVSGSAIPRVVLSDLKKISVPVPAYKEQKDISDLLSSLDSKIDLLRRQNETLEKMAETLFRQWFVEEAMADWRKGTLQEFVEIRYGKDHKSIEEGSIPIYGSGGIMRYGNQYLCDQESVLVPRKGTLSNVILVYEPFWTVDTMFYTKMKKEHSVKYVYHLVKEIDLENMNVGTAVPSMTTQALYAYEVKVPPDNLIVKFENCVSPFYDKMRMNQKQINKLSLLRDTLLPKLMSGEVRVKKDG